MTLKEALDQGKTERDIATNDETFPQWCKYFRAIERYRRIQAPGRDWLTHTTVYYGPPGVGKSSRALLEGGPDSFWLPKPSGKTSTLWWDGYEGQSTVIIDEFYGWISRDLMCRICDRYPLNVETKGGTVRFMAKKVIITSNQHPTEWWKIGLGPMERRLSGDNGKIVHIKEFTRPEDPILYQCVRCKGPGAADEFSLCDRCFPPLGS
jgi:hypothetical protein